MSLKGVLMLQAGGVAKLDIEMKIGQIIRLNVVEKSFYPVACSGRAANRLAVRSTRCRLDFTLEIWMSSWPQWSRNGSISLISF